MFDQIIPIVNALLTIVASHVPGTERYMYDIVIDSISPVFKKYYLVHHMDAIEVSHRACKEEFLRNLLFFPFYPRRFSFNSNYMFTKVV